MPFRSHIHIVYQILLFLLATRGGAVAQTVIVTPTVEDGLSQGYVSPIWAVPAPAPIPKTPAQGKVTSTCHPS
ncbi:MAG: hypothetical protein R2830_00330 [Saprospiraceae bacterium]